MSMRENILRLTAGIISKEGFEAASMRAVCKAAGVTAPTLYHYFADKNDLLDEVTSLAFNKHLELTLKLSRTQDTLKDLKSIWDFYIDFALNESELYLCIVYAHAQGRIHPSGVKCFEITTDLFKAAKEQGKLIYHPKKAAQVYYSAAQGAALLMLSQNKNKELLSGSNLLRDITLNGLIK